MPNANEVVITVRGEWTSVVEPDEGTLSAAVEVEDPDRSAAMRRAAAVQRELEDALGSLGGQRLTAATRRAGLTWSSAATRTTPVWEHTKERRTRTGWSCSVHVVVAIRDLAVLGDLHAALASVDGLEVRTASWAVDEDNPARAETRAEAVRAALRKGGDYAAALDGEVTRVIEIADAGMLGSEPSREVIRAAPMSFRSVEDTPTSEPIPQLLRAAIDARLVASVPAPA